MDTTMRPTTYRTPLQSSLSLAEAFAFLGQRWTAVLVHTLAQRPARFAELRTAVTGISDRLLSERLQDLSRRQLVRRGVAGDHYVRYALTDEGMALALALEGIRVWSELRDDALPREDVPPPPGS